MSRIAELGEELNASLPEGGVRRVFARADLVFGLFRDDLRRGAERARSDRSDVPTDLMHLRSDRDPDVADVVQVAVRQWDYERGDWEFGRSV